jgi:DNA-binding transcriptional ArsR family regulator
VPQTTPAIHRTRAGRGVAAALRAAPFLLDIRSAPHIIVAIFSNYETMSLAMKNSRTMSRRIFEMQCEICKAMAHPIRLEIVETLSEKEIPAAALLAALGTSKANLSKHMALLMRAGIVEQRRTGRQVAYHLTHPDIHKACSIMRSILFRRLKKDELVVSAIEVPRAGRGRGARALPTGQKL